MYLAEVKIDGFRCFKSAEFAFQQGLNAVVGRNNTGKTNLFNAIRHTLGPSATRGDQIWLAEDDFFRSAASGERCEIIKIQLIFDGLTADDRARFFELLDYDLANPDKSKAKLFFEASWPKGKRYPDVKRWGGASTSDRSSVGPEILAQIPITFLPALRDAEAALTPGNRSRLALLLQDLARRDAAGASETAIVQIFQKANAELEQAGLLKTAKTAIQASTGQMAGSDYAPCSINASPPKFDRILRTLRIQMDGAPLEDISANGLGYNNLLYMAAVLAHLENLGKDDTPLLLVEEPEAHLHPQLTVLLADYLSLLTDRAKPPQVIVTTHSTTFASHISPSRISISHFDIKTDDYRCNALLRAGLTPAEERELRRMLDLTRATMYFAKGVILVEGISEALLIPALAKRLGFNLSERHISVIPICGVAFGTFNKVFTEHALNIPVAIVTDGDPAKTSTDWKIAEPKTKNGAIVMGPRAEAVARLFGGRANVHVATSSVTLEYDLALAGNNNPLALADLWEQCFEGQPRTLNKKMLEPLKGDLGAQALAIWRGICVADTAGSKAELANKLADKLIVKDDKGKFSADFAVPSYISDAIKFVWKSLEPKPPAPKAASK